MKFIFYSPIAFEPWVVLGVVAAGAIAAAAGGGGGGGGNGY